jgi:hypothetical protein
MNFETRIKNIEKYLNQGLYLEDVEFDKFKLLDQKYLNFQIDDCYSFQNQVTGRIRETIFNILFATYQKWKIELLKLEIPFYLGVWIYDPRLPKSEIVCAIGKEKIDYYKNHCLESESHIEKIIDVRDFEAEGDFLKWSKKIDSEIIEEWEINFPKENYASEKIWKEKQTFFESFIEKSYKVTESEKGKIYYVKVGNIWTGEFIMKEKKRATTRGVLNAGF